MKRAGDEVEIGRGDLIFQRTKKGALAILAGLGAAGASEGSLLIEFNQVGLDVVATYNGSVNIDDLTIDTGMGASSSAIFPDQNFLWLGSSVSGTMDTYLVTPPGATVGPGSLSFATAAIGDWIALDGSRIGFEQGYGTGDPIVGTTTFAGQDYGMLGLTPGDYVWSWGTTNPDTITLSIVAAVPEASESVLVMGGLTGLLLGLRRRKGLG